MRNSDSKKQTFGTILIINGTQQWKDSWGFPKLYQKGVIERQSKEVFMPRKVSTTIKVTTLNISLTVFNATKYW